MKPTEAIARLTLSALLFAGSAPSLSAAAPAVMPTVRAGYWELTKTMPGRPPLVEHKCRGAAAPAVPLRKECTTLAVNRATDAKYLIDARCAARGMNMSLHVEVSGDLQTRFSGDLTSRMRMAPNQPEMVGHEHTDARYLGSCPAGMKPSDAG